MSYWHQYQANAANQGFVSITTRPAFAEKWQYEVGTVAFASPVIGLDGTIYLGNLAGELLALAPNGSLKWRKQLGDRGSFISGSCAVDSEGNIYVITTFHAIVRDHRGRNTQVIPYHYARSQLHSLTPEGNVRWSFLFPRTDIGSSTDGYTLSSPKISGSQKQIIFVPAIFSRISPRLDLLAIDLSGNLVSSITVSHYPIPPVVVDGIGLGDIFSGIWEFLNGAEFNPSGGGPTLKQQFGRAEPTVAIADFGRLRDQPILVIDDNYQQLSVLRWSSNTFTPLWNKKSSRVRSAASPAIFLSSMVAAGEENGFLALYDLLTGNELWQPWYRARKAIQSPPASFVSQIFLISDTRVIALDANGKLIRDFEMSTNALGAALGSPAISANQVYVNAQEGLFSFSLGLDSFIKNTQVPGGVSSPAIGDDGTIYAVDRNKKLWAFE